MFLNWGLECVLEEVVNFGGLNFSVRKLKEFFRIVVFGYDFLDMV